MSIKITCDSTCDVPKALIEKYDIHIYPLTIVKNDMQFKDGVDITPEDIFDFVESGAGACHTVAVNVAEYAEFFSRFANTYDAVIHFNLSSALSSCYQNAVIAASDYTNVYVVDSLNLSSGSGHLVLDAALMAQSGKTAEEIVAVSNARAKKVEASFVIDTLKYLYKGGRCSGVAALGANVLKLKPCIEVVDGSMQVGKKYRGNFDKVILEYVRDQLSGRDDIDSRRIFITHPSGVPDSVVHSVIEAINSIRHFDEVIESVAGCTISNHCGPVCLGVIFYRK
jgi:DegV family protein with EDD domain